MKFYGSFSITPEIPIEIQGLKRLAYNLWWCWNPEAEELFKIIDSKLWEEVNKNPVVFLSKVDYERLKEVTNKKEFIRNYKQVINNFDNYLKEEDTWFNSNFSSLINDEQKVIAYFSTEFGFHESLPIYSGGLGVLAGDHCKSASDLGLPFIGVGLLYRHGYFRQKINNKGWQEALHPNLNFNRLPITTVKDEAGEELLIEVDLLDRKVYAKVWEVKVGRISVYLLDTDLEANQGHDRQITSRLYEGDQEKRICQEIILGIGGVKALSKMGYEPVVWHMNEGHSAYLGLERIRELIHEKGLNFEQALEKVASNTVFTTHTPVPAGNETFPFELKEKYFSKYWNQLGISKEDFMQLGCVDYQKCEDFGLTVLALKLARFNNGVSRLHGKVASEMWESLWPNVPVTENPITYITNGIHTLTWLAPEWKKLLDHYLPIDWKNRIKHSEIWKKAKEIPDNKFWQVHQDLKVKMIDYIHKSNLERKRRYEVVEDEDEIKLNKDKLTIGFARRFATYKRANLIFSDLERLKKICNQEGKEVQIIFAGKAHPADVPGQELIKEIHDIAESDDFKGKVIILEDYDMNLARYLVQGVDVWLNNPRRPLEASGTSGQKAAANGGLNFSVLDGWWCEGYNGKNGWAIGHKSEYSNNQEQDLIDSNSIYKILEEEIIPLYYDHNEDGIPERWIKRMKEAMVTNAPEYSTDRMVEEYTERLYIPALKRGKELWKHDYQQAKELAEWKAKLRNNWHEINLSVQKQADHNYNINENINLSVQVKLGSLKPTDVKVEVYLATAKDDEKIESIPMKLKEERKNGIYIYNAKVRLCQSGTYNYTFRITPNHKRLTQKHELGLIKWL
ncbi:alpha-glucan family phosphorylase [Natroniella sulfidigena]|uniref:alpha-glucan family phosphorylase n=1 Tax=Natroniella sulfidigena TaxID=723921 RepID=UPI00200A034E|nr:alpha-glucan family phosphorylase [Natroniella sulfidigena]MCK8817319.1 alpha-glucan family phosphorylase [Natroniella sulfidigena]